VAHRRLTTDWSRTVYRSIERRLRGYVKCFLARARRQTRLAAQSGSVKFTVLQILLRIIIYEKSIMKTFQKMIENRNVLAAVKLSEL